MTTERKEFRRLMGEASALSTEDAMFVEVEQRIAAGEDWARVEWDALIRESDLLRAALPQVEVPADLEARLLGAIETGGPSAGRRWPRIAAAAAAVLLITLASMNGTPCPASRLSVNPTAAPSIASASAEFACCGPWGQSPMMIIFKSFLKIFII